MQNERIDIAMAIFRDPNKLIGAIRMLRPDYAKMEVLSPFLLEDLEELLPQEPSGVRWYALLGILSGAAFAMAFQIATVLWWPLNTGGKPIISITSFIPIMFESMVLAGSIATLMGLFLTAELPGFTSRPYYRGASESDFALYVWHAPWEYGELENRLRESGAWEIRPYAPAAVAAGKR